MSCLCAEVFMGWRNTFFKSASRFCVYIYIYTHINHSLSQECIPFLCICSVRLTWVYKLCTTIFFVCRNSHGEMETTLCSTTLTQIPFQTVMRKRITSCTGVSTEQQTSLDHFMPQLFRSRVLVQVLFWLRIWEAKDCLYKNKNKPEQYKIWVAL